MSRDVDQAAIDRQNRLDMFAAAALPSLASIFNPLSSAATIVEHSYDVAYAMEAERDRRMSLEL